MINGLIIVIELRFCDIADTDVYNLYTSQVTTYRTYNQGRQTGGGLNPP